MARPFTALTRFPRRVARAYHLACARDDLQASGLRVPLGVWFCDHCRLTLWEADAFDLHLASHPA